MTTAGNNREHETASGDTVLVTASTTNKLVRCAQTGRSIWLPLGISPAMEICPICFLPKGTGLGKCNFTVESEK